MRRVEGKNRPTFIDERDEANCLDCPWGVKNKVAVTHAARHHDATGHTVETTIDRTVRYAREPSPDSCQWREALSEHLAREVQHARDRGLI